MVPFDTRPPGGPPGLGNHLLQITGEKSRSCLALTQRSVASPQVHLHEGICEHIVRHMAFPLHPWLAAEQRTKEEEEAVAEQATGQPEPKVAVNAA